MRISFGYVAGSVMLRSQHKQAQARHASRSDIAISVRIRRSMGYSMPKVQCTQTPQNSMGKYLGPYIACIESGGPQSYRRLPEPHDVVRSS